MQGRVLYAFKQVQTSVPPKKVCVLERAVISCKCLFVAQVDITQTEDLILIGLTKHSTSHKIRFANTCVEDKEGLAEWHEPENKENGEEQEAQE